MRVPRIILVPTDLTESSLEALLYANEVARLFNAEVIALHVIEPRSASGTRSPSELRDAEFEARKSIIHLLMEHTIVPQNLRLEMVHGSPLEGIIQSIHHFHADMVVIASRGRTGLRQALAGSIAEGVVRFSPVPVLTVRAEGPDEVAEIKEEDIRINLHLN